MKICLVKHPYYMNWGWRSFRYSDPESALDAWKHRSHNLSLVIGMEADMWVIKGKTVDPAFSIDRKDPRGLTEMLKAHECVGWDGVPWEDYDVVITIDPIVSWRLAKKYPRTLWVYNEPSHRSGRGQAAARGGPSRPYDLFWNHHILLSPKTLRRLPQPIGFPYFTNPDIMRGLIKPTNEPAVFIDSRHVFGIPRKERHAMAHDFRHMCGLPVRHAPLDGKVTVSYSRVYFLSQRRMMCCREYLQLLGSCKYSLIWRKRAVLGQGAAEAASLGLMVIANANGVYHQMVCHPTCLIPPGGPPRKGLRLIQKIEKDPDWQKEILAYQYAALMKRFWDEPLHILERALEMKRN